MSTGTLKNIGPLETLTFPIPEAGGVVVFHGRNGSGKSTALRAIDTTVSGKGKVSVRDGTLKGEIDAFGVRVSLARSIRRTGEAEVVSLEGRFSVADLVDPGMKDPDAADAKRIKALVQLSGARPTPPCSIRWSAVSRHLKPT